MTHQHEGSDHGRRIKTQIALIAATAAAATSISACGATEQQAAKKPVRPTESVQPTPSDAAPSSPGQTSASRELQRVLNDSGRLIAGAAIGELQKSTDNTQIGHTKSGVEIIQNGPNDHPAAAINYAPKRRLIKVALVGEGLVQSTLRFSASEGTPSNLSLAGIRKVINAPSTEVLLASAITDRVLSHAVVLRQDAGQFYGADHASANILADVMSKHPDERALISTAKAQNSFETAVPQTVGTTLQELFPTAST